MRSGVSWGYAFGLCRFEMSEMQRDGVEVEQEMHVWFGLHHSFSYFSGGLSRYP